MIFKINRNLFSLKYQHGRSKFYSLTNFSIFNFSDKGPKIDPKGDYYKKLMLKPNATFQDIKKAYYLLSKRYHPDQQNGKDTLYNQIRQAYDVLSNQKLRRQYDSLTQNGKESSTNQNAKQEKIYDKFTQDQYERYYQQNYGNFVGKQNYFHSKQEWEKIRSGVNKSSFILKQSQIFKKSGSGSDEEILDHAKKKLKYKINNQQVEKNKKIDFDQNNNFKNIGQQLRQKHQLRIKKIQNQLLMKRRKEIETGFLGGLINRIKKVLNKQSSTQK